MSCCCATYEHSDLSGIRYTVDRKCLPASTSLDLGHCYDAEHRGACTMEGCSGITLAIGETIRRIETADDQ